MSIELVVYLRRSALPTRATWQQAISTAGFPLVLDYQFDPQTFSGFLPCRFNDMTSGFEFFPGPLPEQDRLPAGVPEGTNVRVAFVTHSDLRELACSLGAASSLCQVADGILYDPQAGEWLSADRVVPWAIDQIEAFQHEIG